MGIKHDPCRKNRKPMSKSPDREILLEPAIAMTRKMTMESTPTRNKPVAIPKLIRRKTDMIPGIKKMIREKHITSLNLSKKEINLPLSYPKRREKLQLGRRSKSQTRIPLPKFSKT